MLVLVSKASRVVAPLVASVLSSALPISSTATACMEGSTPSFSHSASSELSRIGVDAPAQIIDASVRTYIGTVEQNAKGRIDITGKNRYFIVSMSGGEYYGHEFEQPFKFEIDAVGGVPSSCGVSCESTVVRTRGDGENLTVDCEMHFSISLCADESEPCLCRAEFSPNEKAQRSTYLACFPSKTDTLWSVAKRYGVPVSAISEKNSVPNAPNADSADSLRGVNYVLL